MTTETTETAQTAFSTSNNQTTNTRPEEEDFKARPGNKALAVRTGQVGFTITVRETLETRTTRDLDLTDTLVAVSTAVTGDALTGISGPIGLTNYSFSPFL